MKYTIIIGIISIIVIVIILFLIKKSFGVEMFVSTDEAIKNVASIYNSDTMIIKNLNVTGAFNLIPKGIIVAWNGTVPPVGWALCNGTNGTPNLTEKFIMGYSTLRPINSTGGEATHILTIDEMPTHNHNLSGNADDEGYCKTLPCGMQISDRTTNDKTYDPQNARTTITYTGGNKPHNTIPPYYALAYIMKL